MQSMQTIENDFNSDSKHNNNEILFRAKNPDTFIQVKTRIVNGGTQLIAICTDITKVIEIEKKTHKMKSIFFSSVAHELRTPLNSIIPIIKMILMAFENVLDDKIKKYLTIIHNSAIHLQNVIEDALDMSRLENNKF